MIHSKIKSSSNLNHAMYEGVTAKYIILCLKATIKDQWEQIADGLGINF